MIRTAIVDDESTACEQLRLLLEGERDLKIVAECSSTQEALDAVRDHAPDLLIIDIEMPGFSGIDVLHKIPETKRPNVLFLAAHDTFAVQAFEEAAVDYIVKPYSHSRLAAGLDRVRRRIQLERAADGQDDMNEMLHPAARRRTAFKSGTRTILVQLQELEWLEAQRDYVMLHLGKEQHLIRSTMSQLEEDLDRNLFCRIHRSAIVNIDCIKEFKAHSSGESMVVLRNGKQLIVGRNYRHSLLKALDIRPAK